MESTPVGTTTDTAQHDPTNMRWFTTPGGREVCTPDTVSENDPSPSPDDPSGSDLRAEILHAAEECVCRDRNRDYGDAEDNFADVASVLNTVLAGKMKDDLNSLDAAMIGLVIKLCRMKTSPEHLDHWVDMAGYSACGGGIVLRRK